MQINVNNQAVDADVAAEMPLLWVLRDTLGMTGTKFGCGIAQCGACTVHVDGVATRSCITPAGSIGAKKVTTIEGLSANGDHPLQKAWIAAGVPQCGYCQSGQLMTAAALLKKNSKPNRKQIVDAMSGNICRCGTYQQIVQAIESAAGVSAKGAASPAAPKPVAKKA